MSIITHRDITLSRSKIVVTIPSDWEIDDNTAAQKYGKGDAAKVNLALMQRTCKFDGQSWTIDDIRERIKGRDHLELMGAFFGGDDEEGEGNE